MAEDLRAARNGPAARDMSVRSAENGPRAAPRHAGAGPVSGGPRCRACPLETGAPAGRDGARYPERRRARQRSGTNGANGSLFEKGSRRRSGSSSTRIVTSGPSGRSAPFRGSSPSGCDAWRKRPASGRSVENRALPGDMSRVQGDRWRVLRGPARSRRPARRWSGRGPPPRRAPDASCRPARTGRDPAPRSHHGWPSRRPDRPERAAQDRRGHGGPERCPVDGFPAKRPEPGPAGRPDLHQDR